MVVVPEHDRAGVAFIEILKGHIERVRRLHPHRQAEHAEVEWKDDEHLREHAPRDKAVVCIPVLAPLTLKLEPVLAVAVVVVSEIVLTGLRWPDGGENRRPAGVGVDGRGEGGCENDELEQARERQIADDL